MTTPLSGAISMNDLNKELGTASPYNQTISLNDTLVRTLLGRSSGTISLSDGYNKSSSVKITAANTQNLNIWNAAVAAGWNKSSAVEYTIPAGTYIWSDSVSLPALETGGSFPGGLTIINNGYIMGKGGKGASAPRPYYAGGSIAATSGGAAINLTTNCTIDNRNGYIGGGGGGGGGLNLQLNNNPNLMHSGGGGAGGGDGGDAGGNSGQYSASVVCGSGGAIGQSGSNGRDDLANNANAYGSAGGGGRIMPGVGAPGANLSTSSGNYPMHKVGLGGGAGGSGAIVGYKMTGISGAGGSAGSPGGVGSNTTASGATTLRIGGGGGGWGASGGAGKSFSANTTGETLISAGAGGKAINTNSNTVTWTGGFPASRVYGAVS